MRYFNIVKPKKQESWNSQEQSGIIGLLTILLISSLAFTFNSSTAQNYTGHSVMICESGEIMTFGRNVSCQLGLGSTSPTLYDVPQHVPGYDNAVGVAVGYIHNLAVLDDGSVIAWGSNHSGCCGVSGPSVVCSPVVVDLPGCAVAVAAGQSFSMALLADGTIWAWGTDVKGQLGNDGSVSTGHIPVQVSGITNAVAISAGTSHGMALLSDGTVKTWGYGSSGRLGNGGTTDQFTPVTVLTPSGTLSDIVKIDAGGGHCVALSDDNDVYAWGANTSGQLGIGTYSSVEDEPEYSSGFSSGTVVDVAAGSNHSMVLRNNGSTRVAGSNQRLQLGLVSPSSGPWPNTPIAGPTMSGAIDVVLPATTRHGWAITSAGDVYAWGDNNHGAIGTANPNEEVAPPDHVSGLGCDAIPSDDNHPQPCCVAVEEDEREVLEDETISSSITYSSQDMALFGQVVVASGVTVTFADCDVVCGGNASLVVESGAKVVINRKSHFYACEEMWQGITVENGAEIHVVQESLIEDAMTALDMEDGVEHYLNTAIFNRNLVHISIEEPLAGSPASGVHRIKNCRFLCQTTASIPTTHPVHDVLLPPLTGWTTWRGIHAQDARGLLVGSSGNGNEFDNCGWGVWTQRTDNVEVLHNTFTDVHNTGVRVEEGNGVTHDHTIDISYNEIDRSTYGVFCYDNDTTVRTKITYNDIDFAGMSATPYEKVGITVEEITPATEHNTANFLDVSHNVIYNAPMGIELMNLQGDLFTADAALYVGDNYITHSKDASYATGSGIKTNYVTQGAFIRDTVTHPSGHVNWWETGMRFSHGSANAIICNNTHDVGRGMFFDGWQSDTEFINNIMDNNQIGLFLNWAVIGQQGSSGNPWDNRWLGTSWSSSDPNTHVEGTDGTLSPFYVRSSTPYNPQYNTYNGSPAAISVTTTTGSWGGGCGTITGASFKTDGTQSNGNDLLSIMELPEPETDRERSLQYMGRYNLYKKLLTDAEVASSEPQLQSFFEEHNAGNMGVLHHAIADFRAARKGELEIGPSLATLGTIEPTNLVEETLKDVLLTLYTNADDLGQMNVSDEVRLREIAQLCPLDYGFGVYTARAALLKLDTLPIHYVAECERVPAPEQISEKFGAEKEDENIFNAYPNPANTSLTVNYDLKQGETGRLQMLDVSGRMIRMMELKPGRNSIELQVSDVSEGLYILNIQVNGQARLSERITVIRP